MNKIYFFLPLNFFLVFSLKAQHKHEAIKSVYSEARYHYFLKTILLFNEYLQTDSGTFNTSEIRFLHPIANKAWNLRIDLPLISTNSNSTNQTGIGDIGAGISYIPYLRQQTGGVAFRTKVISNSASDPARGSGKWVFAPAIFYGKYLRKDKIIWISSLENQLSFAGSANRDEINTIALENYFMLSTGKNWLAADIAFRYDATKKGFPNNAFLEFGRRITTTNMMYIHPSIAFGNHKSYKYGIEVGALFLF